MPPWQSLGLRKPGQNLCPSLPYSETLATNRLHGQYSGFPYLSPFLLAQHENFHSTHIDLVSVFQTSSAYYGKTFGLGVRKSGFELWLCYFFIRRLWAKILNHAETQFPHL